MRYELPDEYDNRSYLEGELDFWIFDPIRRFIDLSLLGKLKVIGYGILGYVCFWLMCAWAAI